MAQKTLWEVLTASLDDADFRHALLSDHRAALTSRNWELTPTDMQQLDGFMKYDQTADAGTILEWFSHVARGGDPPPPPPLWRPIQPFREMT